MNANKPFFEQSLLKKYCWKNDLMVDSWLDY